MRSALIYQGYSGRGEIDRAAGLLFGRVLDIGDVTTFQGATVDEVRRAFADSIDDYLTYCAGLEQQPERPFSGKVRGR